jgi:Flp pilus assembly protein TadD
MTDDRNPDAAQDDPAALDDVERYRWACRLLSSGDPHSALQVLRPLLDSETGNPAVLLVGARAAFDSAQVERAETLFRRIIELDPSDLYAHAGLGRTLQRRHRHREALPYLRIASALSPEPWYAEALKRAEEAVASERSRHRPAPAHPDPDTDLT